MFQALLHEHVSVYDYYTRARQITKEIIQRGKTPIVCGGAGFYLRCYLYGLPPTGSAPPPEEREQANAVAEVSATRSLTATNTPQNLVADWETGSLRVEEIYGSAVAQSPYLLVRKAPAHPNSLQTAESATRECAPHRPRIGSP